MSFSRSSLNEANEIFKNLELEFVLFKVFIKTEPEQELIHLDSTLNQGEKNEYNRFVRTTS